VVRTHRNAKGEFGPPLVLPVGATFDDVLRRAGQGSYRLNIVDRNGQKIEGIPAAYTGEMLSDLTGETDEIELDQQENDEDVLMTSPRPGVPRRVSSTETLLMHSVSANTQLLGQFVASVVPMMNACTVSAVT
jgi:hypothetical protein